MAYEQGRSGRGGLARRLTTETKQAFKTTEFWTFLIVAILILIAANQIEGEEGGGDYFAADKAWLYVTILTAAYLLSRGLAKSGARDPYWDRPGGDDEGGPPLTERVKTAATVLREGETSGQSGGEGSGRPG